MSIESGRQITMEGKRMSSLKRMGRVSMVALVVLALAGYGYAGQPSGGGKPDKNKPPVVRGRKETT